MAYAAFRFYRDLGEQRAAAKVREKFGISLRLVERWSSVHAWVLRRPPSSSASAPTSKQTARGLEPEGSGRDRRRQRRRSSSGLGHAHRGDLDGAPC